MDTAEIILSYIGSFIVAIPVSGILLCSLFIPFEQGEPDYKKYIAINLIVLILGAIGIFYFINFGGGRGFWESDEKRIESFGGIGFFAIFIGIVALILKFIETISKKIKTLF